jgi:hypothetical protein
MALFSHWKTMFDGRFAALNAILYYTTLYQVNHAATHLYG